MKINHVKKITDCKHLNLFSIRYNDRESCEKQWIFASRSKRLNPLEQDREQASDIIENNRIKFDVKSWIVLNTFASQGIL